MSQIEARHLFPSCSPILPSGETRADFDQSGQIFTTYGLQSGTVSTQRSWAVLLASSLRLRLEAYNVTAKNYFDTTSSGKRASPLAFLNVDEDTTEIPRIRAGFLSCCWHLPSPDDHGDKPPSRLSQNQPRRELRSDDLPRSTREPHWSHRPIPHVRPRVRLRRN